MAHQWHPDDETPDLERQRKAVTWFQSLAGEVIAHGACNHCRKNAAMGLEQLGLLTERLEKLGVPDPRSLTRGEEPSNVMRDWTSQP